MEGGVWPIFNFINQSMFDRVKVYIISMFYKIIFITDKMFPKTSLPDNGLPMLRSRSSQKCFLMTEYPYSFRIICFNKTPAFGEIGIVRGQSPDAMHMIGKDYPGINGERHFFPYFGYNFPQNI